MNDLVSNPSLAGPVNFVPSLAKIPGDPFTITPVIKKESFDFERTCARNLISTFLLLQELH
jgi:hypothetical protein